MTPTIVFSKLDDLPMIIIGSAGGSRIIGHVTQRIIDILYNKKTLQESIESPHILNRGQITEAEINSKTSDDLITKGHKIFTDEIGQLLKEKHKT